MVFILQIYHNSIGTCLMRIGHDGHEELKKGRICKRTVGMNHLSCLLSFFFLI